MFLLRRTLYRYIFITTLLLGCSLPAYAKEIILQLPWHHQFQFAGYYMAKELGYYRNAGLDVKIQDVSKSKDVVGSVISGQAHFAISSSGLLIEHSLGKPVVAVATILQNSPAVFLTRKDSGIRSADDLIGKKVMLAPGHKSLSLLVLLQQRQLSEKIIKQKTSYNLDSLLNGETDAFNAYYTNEPFLAAEKGQDVNVIKPQDYGIHFYGDTLFTSEAFLRQRPKDVESFRLATIEGWRYAMSHQGEAIELLKNVYGVEKSIAALRFEAEAIFEVMNPEQVEIGQMDMARWAQISHYLIASGHLPPSFHLTESFLYQPPRKFDWQGHYPSLLAIGLVFFLLLVLVSMLFRANQRTKNALKQLQANEERLREALDAVSDGIWDWNVKTSHASIDRRSKEMFGLDPDEEYGPEEIFTQIDPDDLPHIQAALQDHIKGHKDSYDHSFRVHRSDGTTRWVRGRGRVIERDHNNNPIRLIGTNTDITEQVLADERQRRSERRFRQMIEQVSGISIQGYNEQRQVIYWNKASEELYGYSATEALGRRLEELIIPEPMREAVIQKVTDWVEKEIEIPAGELLLIGKDGQKVPVFSSHVMNETPDGKEMFCIDIDLKPLKEAEKRRLELEEQLRQTYKMEAIGTMAGGIAHDFNNHLAIILGNAELATLKMAQESPLRTYLEQIKTTANRSKELVRQILLYSRRSDHDLKPVRLSLVIEETLKMLRPTIPSSVQIDLQIANDAAPLLIAADSTQLQQILINLSSNAIHGMNEKGILKIELHKTELTASDLQMKENLLPGQYLQLTVSDNGCGIPPQILEKIFDPFFTTKDIDKGTGMGLAVVHGIVESHNGMIKAASAEGEGSCFTIYLPTIKSTEKRKLLQASPLPTGNERILILDDEESLASLCAEILAEYGYQTHFETSSNRVLQLFREDPQKYDLLISDQTMPELSGSELAKQLLQLRPNLPIILCTGYSAKVSPEEAEQLGLHSFCFKPLDTDQLVKTVRKALDDKN
ncbi:PAS domain S-box-containing protein [Malonomonas rubra DSM 5091]|uniref:histidine kinase n=1 Tax=Malonomonas rubra DSM 5091 TaxID=1122189 RepID=A0A1M6MPU8_MALRU|nr:ABC transporter substrate-binding protein [Malonomonas rubra]SHJ85449.1 PAS domain S-box-containing protein [Malonomonas rubra DSM 5091]